VEPFFRRHPRKQAGKTSPPWRGGGKSPRTLPGCVLFRGKFRGCRRKTAPPPATSLARLRRAVYACPADHLVTLSPCHPVTLSPCHPCRLVGAAGIFGQVVTGAALSLKFSQLERMAARLGGSPAMNTGKPAGLRHLPNDKERAFAEVSHGCVKRSLRQRRLR
jgi:hypothetical protein